MRARGKGEQVDVEPRGGRDASGQLGLHVRGLETAQPARFLVDLEGLVAEREELAPESEDPFPCFGRPGRGEKLLPSKSAPV